VTKATAAGVPVSVFPETTLLPLPASRLREDFRRLLISEIGNAKVSAREEAISDPKSVPAEDFGQEMTACERDLDEKDDGNLLEVSTLKRTPALNEHRLSAALPLRILLARDAIGSGYSISRGRRRIMLQRMKSNRLWKPSGQSTAAGARWVCPKRVVSEC
jgi:hypothetical protein